MHEYLKNIMVANWHRTSNDEGFGIGYFLDKNGGLRRYVRRGELVWNRGFNKPARVMMGHGMYMNMGMKENAKSNLHPMWGKKRKLLFAFNGNVPNHVELRKKFFPRHKFATDGDTETLASLLELFLEKEKNAFKAVRRLFEVIDGPCNFGAMLWDGTLIAGRSPDGNKPLCYATDGDLFSFCSETTGLAPYYDNVSDFRPGQVLVVKDGAIDTRTFAIKPEKICPFEYIYFGDASTEFDGVLNEQVRIRMGQMAADRILSLLAAWSGRTGLSAEETAALTDNLVVIPVPDSSVPFGIGVAESLYTKKLASLLRRHKDEPFKVGELAARIEKRAEPNISFRRGVQKRRFGKIGRSFLLPTEKQRKHAAALKHHVIKEYIKDRHVIVVDDSIVRGTTSRQVIGKKIRRRWPRSIGMVSAFPPIRHPCPYAIDMQTGEELIAHGRTEQEIARKIGADYLIYMTMKDISKATGIPLENLCKGCTEGKYEIGAVAKPS